MIDLGGASPRYFNRLLKQRRGSRMPFASSVDGQILIATLRTPHAIVIKNLGSAVCGFLLKSFLRLERTSCQPN